MCVREGVLGGTWIGGREMNRGVGGLWGPPTASDSTPSDIRARRAVRCALRIARGKRMMQNLIKNSFLV